MQNQLPMVSVIVLAYNHVETIDQCLEGVLAQDFEGGLEVVLGEDDSNDGTREKCVEWAKRYPAVIRLFLGSRKDNIAVNGKPSGARNWLECHSQCKGKYIAYCEGDDYWIDSHKIQLQVEALESSEDNVICYHRVKIDRAGTLLSDEDSITEIRFRQIDNPNELSLDDMIEQGNFIHTPSVMIRRESLILPSFAASSAIGDYLNYLAALSNGGRIVKLDNAPMAVYRVGIGTFSGQQYHRKLVDILSCLSVTVTLPLSTEHKKVLFDRSDAIRSELNRYIADLLEREPGTKDLFVILWKKIKRRLSWNQ